MLDSTPRAACPPALLTAAVLLVSVPCLLKAQVAQERNPDPSEISAPAAPTASATAIRVTQPPELDGRLNEALWADAPIISVFTQRDPAEGEPASEATEVRIVYDTEAIYVGARLNDRRPVTTRLGRRDMDLTGSDWFRVSVDSYRDRRSAFRFDVNPSGVRRDATLGDATGGQGGGGGGGGGFTGSEGDLAWDAVWEVRTSIDEEGWTAEYRIPFSQLRFSAAEEQIWGLQLERIIDRNQELAQFSFSAKSEPGGIPAFGELAGLRGIRAGRPLELIPYLLSQAEFTPSEGNLLRDDRELDVNAGLDARFRISSNMTINATVNPDFGQVEVDPAIINLTAFETRLQEKRPFFVEGSSNFRFGGNTLGPSSNAAGLLYTRRLGRAPQVGISGEDVDIPSATGILGAAKLSGKTSSGWSVGVLEAVTNRESGLYLDGDGQPQRLEVEPLSNYFVARLNRELRQGQSSVGGIFSSVNRDLAQDRTAASLRSSAYAGGLDFSHEWAGRSWLIGGYLVGSTVYGSEQAIELTQRSSTRYYQRPDADQISLDESRTSLQGYAASLQLWKRAGEHWTGDWWVSVISPGYEINDMGFQQRADRRATGGAVRYSQRSPGSILRSWNVSASPNFSQNFDGDWFEKLLRGSVSMTHLNYWQLQFGGTFQPERTDDRLTRGGPLVRRPSSWTGQIGVTSDPRRPVAADASVEIGGDEVGSETRSASLNLEVRTTPRWSLSLGPQLQRVREDAQFVAAVPDPQMTSTYGARYVFAPLDQTEVSLVTRFNYTFTPNLTLQVYAQPLIAHAEYGRPKELQNASAYEFATYGSDLGTIDANDGGWDVDPDGSGAAPAFNLRDRSFSTRSIRGNAVLRWEYRAGSTLYLVWQQQRLNSDLMTRFGIDRALGTLFDAPASNALVLKWSYWFNP